MRSSDDEAPQVGPVTGSVSVPPQAIIASGIGHETTQWHREFLPSRQEDDAVIAEQEGRER